MGNLEYAQTIVNDNAINQDKVQKNHDEKEKSTIIIEDSVSKHRNGWKIYKKKLKPSCKVFVRTFPEATT